MSADTLHPTPEELFAYRDGELQAERRVLVEAHVMGCRACREQVDEMSKLEAALRARPEEVGDAYYERMQAQVMAKVHTAAPHAVRAPALDTPLERRRDDAEPEERRGGAPRLPWIAVGSAVSAMAAVVVVVVLLARHGSPPQVAVLERSAPDAALRGAPRDTTAAPPTAGSPAAPAPASGKERALAQQAKPSTGAGESVALLPEANGARDEVARNESKDQAFSKLESAPQAMKSPAAREEVATPGAAGEARERLQAAPPSAAEGRLQSTLGRYGLPQLWGPGVSDELVLRAEPALRNLYRTGGASSALDSARVRIYLAEAARLRAGSAPDSAAIDEITHHYRRAIRLAGEDPATAATAERRLREFLTEVGITP
jgi:putative zinc finger protein